MPEKNPGNRQLSLLVESEVPKDLILMMMLLIIEILAIYLPIVNETPLRYAFALPILIFIPGYCLVAALFPKNQDLDLLERTGLSIGISIALVILMGLGLNFSPWGIRLEPVIIFIALFTTSMFLIAHYRRALLPPEKRLAVRFSDIAGDFRETIVHASERGIDRRLSIILAAVVILAVITTIFVIFFPQQGERFTEFYVLSEKQTSSDYPDPVIPGPEYPLYIGVGNQEQRNVSYTIETWIMQTQFDQPTNTSHINVMDPAGQIKISLRNNETTEIPYSMSVMKSGYNRMEFLLFNESVPGPGVTGSDRINASYREVHLWFNNPLGNVVIANSTSGTV